MLSWIFPKSQLQKLNVENGTADWRWCMTSIL
jgi:hypothetical protein